MSGWYLDTLISDANKAIGVLVIGQTQKRISRAALVEAAGALRRISDTLDKYIATLDKPKEGTDEQGA